MSTSLVTVFELCRQHRLRKTEKKRFTDKYREMFGIHCICSAVQRIQFLLGKTMLSRTVCLVCQCGHLFTSTLSLRSHNSSDCTHEEWQKQQRGEESHHLKYNSCAITGYSF